MRGGFWGAIALVALFVPGAVAGTVAVHGDLDYELDARLEGDLSAGPGSVLTSIAPTDTAPAPRRFHLEAATLDATYFRSYTRMVSRGLPAPADLRTASIEQNEGVERRSYHDVDLTLFETTALWDVVAFAPDNLSAEFRLPRSAYDLANADPAATLLRRDVPQPRMFARDLEGPAAVVREGLRVESDDLAATVRGDFILLLYGGTFDLTATGAAERVVTGRYDEMAPRDDVPIPEPRSVNATAFLRIHDGLLTMEAGDDVVALHARTFHLLGRVAFQRATGQVTVGGETSPVPSALEGDLLLSARGAAYADAQGARFGPLTVRGTTTIPLPADASATLLAAALAAGLVGTGAAAVRWMPGPRRWFFAGLALFSMVKKDEALGMKSRGQLYEYVRSNPGTNLSDVQRVLGLGWGTTLYHVSVLERLDMLVTRRVGSRRMLFINGASRQVDPAAWNAMQNAGVRRLATDLIVPGRGLSQAEIARIIDVSPQYAGRLLRRLEGLGLVAADAAAGRRTYVGTPLLSELAQRASLLPRPVEAPALVVAAPLNA